mmetsp:Transcript_12665/g.30046  ORF Transcript_12665/g.30046 Transcript_12665/m.30046 type:complete len:339 (-) Transcript_12665:119-1135(-)
MNRYEKLEIVGKGTFGEVWKARSKESGELLAIKKIATQKTDGKAMGLDVTALREIKILKELKSPAIVNLKDVFTHKKSIFLVLEFLEHDLEQVIRSPKLRLGEADIKGYMQALLQALAKCHHAWVLHRDIKPNNLLIAPSGQLKLADFGLSRIYGTPTRAYTSQVFAHWYRAPELLYGARFYGASVDIWAAGCVFAEMMLRRPWMPGENDIDQLGKIFQMLGTPTEQQWPGMKELPGFMEFQRTKPVPLRTIFKDASDEALELLSQMVQFDPTRRITAEEALKHRYFCTDPKPTPTAELPRPESKLDNEKSASEGQPQQKKRKAPEPSSPVSPLQPLE